MGDLIYIYGHSPFVWGELRLHVLLRVANFAYFADVFVWRTYRLHVLLRVANFAEVLANVAYMFAICVCLRMAPVTASLFLLQISAVGHDGRDQNLHDLPGWD